MTPRQVRAALRPTFLAAGLREEGPRYVYETPEVLHSIEVTAVRRLAGCVQIHHQILLKPGREVVLTQEVESLGFQSAYPRIWSAECVDSQLVLEQVSAACGAFRTARDIAHFLSDRSHPDLRIEASHAGPQAPANTLCDSQAQQAVQRIARELLAPEFELVPRDEQFEVWSSNQEIEGYRHCAYVQANETCTLAHVEMFALSAAVVQGRFRSDDALRSLMTAPKSALFVAGRPALVPMTAGQAVDWAPIRRALLAHLSEHPPHLQR